MTALELETQRTNSLTLQSHAEALSEPGVVCTLVIPALGRLRQEDGEFVSKMKQTRDSSSVFASQGLDPGKEEMAGWMLGSFPPPPTARPSAFFLQRGGCSPPGVAHAPQPSLLGCLPCSVRPRGAGKQACVPLSPPDRPAPEIAYSLWRRHHPLGRCGKQ